MKRINSFSISQHSSRIQRRRNVLNIFLHFLLILSNLNFTKAKKPNKATNLNNTPSYPPPTPNSSSINSNNSGSGSSTSSTAILEIFEHESFDTVRNMWYGEPTQRWTTSNGSPSDPPTSLKPPPNFNFDSDWKIDVTGKDGLKDKVGWKYFSDGKRQRRWLRTLTPIADGDLKQASSKESKEKKRQAKGTDWLFGPKKSRIKKPSSTSTKPISSKSSKQPLSLLAPFKNDYNFKGFGLSLFKSIIFPTSYGALLRLPLSTNFDFFETRPSIPSITSSAGFFGSHDNWTLVAYLNISMPMEVLRYIVVKIAKILYLLYWCIWKQMVWGSIKFMSSVGMQLIPFITSSSKSKKKSSITTKEKISSILSSRSIQYSADYQERVGCSCSWRISKKRGYEFRVSYSHLYLPTLEYLMLRNRNGNFSNWLKTKTGSLGLSTGGPIPDTPPIASSCVLSLSGFFPSVWFMENLRKASEKDRTSKKTIVEEVSTLTKKNKDETGIIIEEEDEDDNEEEEYKERMITSSGTISKESPVQDIKDTEQKKLLSSSFGWANSS